MIARARARQALRRVLPATLFGRLAWLLLGFTLASHVLSLAVMFQLRPRPTDASTLLMNHQPPMLTLGLALDVGISLAALTLAAWVAASWLSRPVVQAQVHHRPDERDRFVAAVSHDLRTPLTRLRLRAEGLTDAAQQARFQQDIAEMDQMISATLDYLRGAAQAEPLVRLDVHALADSIAEDQQACGHAVEVFGAAAPLMAQASALRRGLCNLVDNALRYGGSAQIHLIDAPDMLHIEVHDRGPGIAPHELEKVLAPFYRIGGSQEKRPHGGVGLGLAIAQDIAHKHRGTLTLRNGEEGGLIASFALPR